MADRLTFGKYKDDPIEEVPADYLEWLIYSSERSITIAKKELARREAQAEANMTMAEKIIYSGYRSLCKEHHPDVGGDEELMKELNLTKEALDNLVKGLNKRKGRS